MAVRDTIVGPKQAKAEPTCIKDPVTDKLLTSPFLKKTFVSVQHYSFVLRWFAWSDNVDSGGF